MIKQSLRQLPRRLLGILFNLLVVLTVMAVAAAFLTHPTTEQSWLSYLLSVAKRWRSQ